MICISKEARLHRSTDSETECAGHKKKARRQPGLLDSPTKSLSYFHWNVAECVVPSMSFTSNRRHVPAQLLSDFQTYTYWEAV